MTMDDVYQGIRTINLVWGMGLFFVMLYFGILDIIYNRSCNKTHVPPEFQQWAMATAYGTFLLAFSIIEIFVDQDNDGGLRVLIVWPFLAIGSVACWNGAHRVLWHKVSIERGHCK